MDDQYKAGFAEGVEAAAQYVARISSTIRDDQMLNLPHTVAMIRALTPSPAPAQPLPDLSHLDLCRLSLLFINACDLRTEQDQRINEWLKAGLSRLSPPPAGKPGEQA